MKYYVVCKVEVTEARCSIDGKKHKHKYYLYPIPENLKDLGFVSHWSYEKGKRGAIKFKSRKEAQAQASEHGGIVEEV